LARLACFDVAAGTPTAIVPATSGSESVPPIVDLVHANEVRRAGGDTHFLMTQAADDSTGAAQQRVVISAPAQGHVPSTVLAISCMSNISRLQFVMSKPLAGNVAQVRLILDARPTGATTRWQVLTSGRVVDAGRGMPAIEMIRRLANGAQLRVESDVPELDGLVFDVTGLGTQIATQRAACRW
jgi:type VI secretion system protein VasI